jgi:RNA polymerase sigma-70 factor (ECF subfamily)
MPRLRHTKTQPPIQALPPMLGPVASTALRIVLATPAPASMALPIQELTGRMARGEEQAYRDFYDLYFRRLFGYLLVVSRGEEDQAREALQLTLLRLVRNIRAFDSEEAFWSWLTVLARTALVDEQRRRMRYFGLLDRFFRKQEDHKAAHPAEAATHLVGLLEKSLSALDAEDRELVERKYFEGQSVKDLAHALGLSEKAVDSRLVRLRKRLKEEIMLCLKNENRS